MGQEYVRFSREERGYGYKNLLHSQLEFLNSMKRFSNYIDLRNKEFSLKVSLKSKTGEVLAEIERLDALLPKTHLGEEHRKKKDKEIEKIDSGLMGEVNAIKEKLYNLQREM